MLPSEWELSLSISHFHCPPFSLFHFLIFLLCKNFHFLNFHSARLFFSSSCFLLRGQPLLAPGIPCMPPAGLYITTTTIIIIIITIIIIIIIIITIFAITLFFSVTWTLSESCASAQQKIIDQMNLWDNEVKTCLYMCCDKMPPSG